MLKQHCWPVLKELLTAPPPTSCWRMPRSKQPRPRMLPRLFLVSERVHQDILHHRGALTYSVLSNSYLSIYIDFIVNPLHTQEQKQGPEIFRRG